MPCGNHRSHQRAERHVAVVLNSDTAIRLIDPSEDHSDNLPKRLLDVGTPLQSGAGRQVKVGHLEMLTEYSFGGN